MSEKPGLIFRLLSSTLLLTSVLVTILLVIIGYQVAIWILESGMTVGQASMVVLAVTPSVCALLSLPFWLTLQRMNRQD
ncbi:MAG: hypothetical protein H7245_06555 [Candidatus Saccharibacteria bacterium]|nr:hypothetical protein [Pseudorhodobacter sp.]